MGFRGSSIGVSFANVGVQHNSNVDAAPPDTFVHPTKNVNLHDGGVGSRGGTSKVNVSVGYGSVQLMGGFDYQKPDGTAQYQIFYSADGKIYRDTSTTIATGLSTTAKPSIVQAGDSVYVCNGVDAPLKGDPSAGNLSAFTNVAADWSSEKPFQFVLHVNGANRRLVALSSNKVHFSANGTLDEFVTGVISFTVNARGGLRGGVMFGTRLIVFGREEAFIFDTDDTDTTKWGYSKAPWVGGVAHFRLIMPIENDVLLVTEDATLYSVGRVQEFGDYRKADLTRPAFMDRWLREHGRLANIADWHATWDPKLRMAKIFIVRAGRTEVEASLNFYPDRPLDRAFTVHENIGVSSGYNASCSFLVRVGAGDYQVYTGDYDGFVWKLEQTSKNDNSAAYASSFRTPHLNFGDPRRSKRFVRGFLIFEPKGSFNLTVNIWVDGQVKTSTTLSMAGTGALLGSFVLGTDVLGGRTMIKTAFDLGYRGERLQLEFINTAANEPFFVSQLLVDFILLGARPQ